jgi:CRISPR system Cascade subunit CasA
MPPAPLLLHSLLDEPVLGVEDDHGVRETVTLAGLLARLSNGAPTALTAVQAHQQHAVHAFLVQLAAIALERGGISDLAHDEPEWRKLLLGAAKEDGAGAEAFTLVVGDLAKPAFLQPPVPEGTLDALKNVHTRLGAELDVLITSKNHDVKMDRVDRPSVEQWVLALLTLQTMQGFLGAGNYGIARMNGGFASRPCVAFAPDQAAAPRFLRDVRALRDGRDSLPCQGRLAFVWCAPWKGDTSLALSKLDPFFIEICRRIRLSAAPDGTIVAHRGSSKVARIDAKDASGNTGDAWTPVARDGKALTMSERGFNYARVRDLMFPEGEWRAGPAGGFHGEHGDRFWVGQVLVRGQGKTGGYHERWIPFPAKARAIFAKADARSRLAARSKTWVERVSVARLKILKPALLTLLQGAPEKLKFDDDRADVFLDRLDGTVDDEFFPMLFAHADEPDEVALAAFENRLVELGREQLQSALRSLPVPCARRWRADAHARAVFEGSARHNFHAAFPSANPAEVASTRGDSP